MEDAIDRMMDDIEMCLGQPYIGVKIESYNQIIQNENNIINSEEIKP